MKKPQCTTCDLCVAKRAPHSWNFNYLPYPSHFMLINFLLLQHTPNLFVFIFSIYFSDAHAVFEEMKRLGITPTMKSHMLLLTAYSKTGNVAKCEGIINQMHKSGLKPDTFVINSMLNLYGRLGQFEKMEEVLTAMEKGSYAADISTYNILINIYGRGGFIEKMEGLFQSLPAKRLKPDVVTWTSRLAAYSRKKLYRRCLEIFEEMIDAGCYPDGGTAKVLISACSSEDQIEQVTTLVRTMHKDMKTALPIYLNLYGEKGVARSNLGQYIGN